MLTDPKNSQPSLEKGGSEKLVSLLPLLKALEKYLEKELLPYSVDGMQALVDLNFFFGRLYHMGIFHAGEGKSVSQVGQRLGERLSQMGVGYKVEGIELHPSIAHQAMKKLTEELLCDIKAMVALGDMVKIETKVFRQIIDHYLLVAMQFYERRDSEIEKEYPALGTHKAFLAALAIKNGHCFSQDAVELGGKLLRAVHGSRPKKTALTIYKTVKSLQKAA